MTLVDIHNYEAKWVESVFIASAVKLTEIIFEDFKAGLAWVTTSVSTVDIIESTCLGESTDGATKKVPFLLCELSKSFCHSRCFWLRVYRKERGSFVERFESECRCETEATLRAFMLIWKFALLRGPNATPTPCGLESEQNPYVHYLFPFVCRVFE